MRYSQFRAFHAVAQHGGFSRAAVALGLTQPAISDAVRKLEQSTAVVLFDRHRRGATLTGAGESLFRLTGQLFEIEARAIDLLADTASLKSGSLRIKADSAFHVLRAMSHFRQAFPGIVISLSSGNSSDVIDALMGFEADIGVVAERPARPDLHALQLRADPLVAFVCRAHPLAGRRTITLRRLADHELIMRERGSATRRLIEQEFERIGCRPNMAMEVAGREAVREVVASGLGVGIASRPEAPTEPGIRVLGLSGSTARMREFLICRRDQASSRVVSEFFARAEPAVSSPAAVENE
jgi:aminoethylphosphonate catabolism LysR family transcriptional regulator